ncbi:MAG TPA: ABC transporter permease [Vicinamibacterales bacterium]|nr:ABC transporter permease [Vicinamibacterales bacterium]
MTAREWIARLKGALGLGRRERDLEQELEFHREMLEARHRARGSDAASARRTARFDLGGAAQIAEAWRDQRSLPLVDALRQDVRYGVRMLKRTPGFSATAILTLALGIGANTAVFTIVDTVLLRPLPYADPDRLVTVGDRNPDGSSANAGFQTMNAWRDRSRTLEGFAAMRPWTPTIVTGGEAERIQAVRVSWNYFDLLGVRPRLGRTFSPQDDDTGDWPPYAILSESLWRRFGSDPSMVGRTVSLNDRAYRIVGVMPASFEALDSEKLYGAPAELWAPIGSYMKGGRAASGTCRGCEQLKVFARLRPGATIAVATSEMGAIREQLRRDNPADYATGSIAVVPLRDALTSDIRPTLLVLLGAVVFVLLIACANVASLLLARSVTRQRELTLRAALGAGRARLVRQLLTESLLLAGIGGLTGVLVASIGVRGLAALAPAALPRLDRAAVDSRVLAFTAVVTVLTSVACGLLPAWRSVERRRERPLTLERRGAVAHRSRARSLLVVADLTLALVLLAGAGLMLRTVFALSRANPGFTADGVLSLRFALTGRAYPSDAAMVGFEQRVLDRMRALSAVEAVAVAGRVPFGGVDGCWGFHAQGRMQSNPADDPCVERYSFAGDYFRVLNIPVIAGRTFTAEDSASGLRVILVSASTAKLVWGSANPIGAQVRIGSATGGAWRTVVGIVGDVHHSDLTTAPAPAMYTPEAQITSAYLTLVARARNGDAAALAPDARAVLRGLDPIVPVYGVAPLSGLVRQSAAQRVFVMRVLSAFAAAAVLLAAVGLYGLVAYSVAERTSEVGVRVALGATQIDVVRLVLASGVWIVGTGITAGLVAAAAGARFLTTLIFGVSPLDPLTMASAAVLLTIVALAAHWIPIRRALRIDPASALRGE